MHSVVCVMGCCGTVFYSLSNSAHAKPAAIDQLVIIVLALDVLIDSLPLVGLHTLLQSDVLHMYIIGM